MKLIVQQINISMMLTEFVTPSVQQAFMPIKLQVNAQIPAQMELIPILQQKLASFAIIHVILAQAPLIQIAFYAILTRLK